MAPPHKKQRVAEEPPSAMWDLLNDEPAIKSIGFVSCPGNMRLDTKEDLKKLEDAVQELIDLGSEFINVTCEKKGVDMNKILQDLKPLIDKTHMRGARSAEGPATFCTDTSVTFWSNSFSTRFLTSTVDPDGGVPASGFFFDTNDGNIAIFATSWPASPGRTRARLLQAYVNSTDADIQRVIGGGSMDQEVVGAENVATRIDTPMDFHVNGTLSLLVSKSNPPNVKLHDMETKGPYSVIADLIGSAERPATNTREPEEPLVQPDEPVVPQEATQLWNDFLDSLPEGDERASLTDYIARVCFHGDLLLRNEDGERLENPMSVSFKMERLLQICKSQREKHIERLRADGDPRCNAEQPAVDYHMIFNEEDMKTIISSWRDDAHSYMNQNNLRKLTTMGPRMVHQQKKSVFSTYCFHISGDKWLLRQFLRAPVGYDSTQAPTSSAEQPAWNDLLSQFREHKNSDEYRTAVADSQQKGVEHVRLSHSIWWARLNHEKGKHVAFLVRAQHRNWHSLSPYEQELAQDYEAGRSANRVKSLIAEKEKKGTARFHLLRMQSLITEKEKKGTARFHLLRMQS